MMWPPSSEQAMRRLWWANLGLVAVMLIHDADHLRQARSWCYAIPQGLWLLNLAVYLPSLLAIVLTRTRRVRWAAVASVAAGTFVAVGFLKIHLLGTSTAVWGVWARPYRALQVDFTSWIVLAVTAAAGAIVALLGVRLLGRRSPARAS